MSSAAGAAPSASDAREATWRVNLAFVWIGVFVGLLGANFVFPFIPFFLQDLGMDSKSDRAYWTGISASVTGLSLTVTAPIWGSMADRYGRKPMFMRALLGAGILIALMGIVTTVWQFVLLRFVMGAFAGTMGAAAALVAATTPRAKVGYALGLLQTAMFSANMLGPFAGGIVAASIGIRESFFFCGALYIAAVALVFFFVKEQGIEPESEGRPAAGKAKGGGLIQNMRVVVSERQIVLMLLLLFALWLSTTFVRPVMPISVDDFADHTTSNEEDDRVHFDAVFRSFELKEETATGLVFGVIGLTSTIAAISVAPIGQRVGYRRSVAGAAMLTGLLYLPVAFAGSYLSYMLFMGAVGLFQGAMVPGTNALIGASVPEGKHGSAFGLAASMQSLALLVGPLGGGAVSGLFGIEWVYAVIGVVLLVAAVFAWLFIREPDVFESGTMKVEG
ncbi:MAG: MFS transporter [Dehalococcoidia bacterium]|nr:MFS transporter [Dehalococcoidia bacterium]